MHLIRFRLICLRMINDLPDNNLLTIHNQETLAENEFFEKGTGDLLRLYNQMGIDISFFTDQQVNQVCKPGYHILQRQQTIILVHNVATTAIDMKFCNHKLQTTNPKLFFCLCPNANLYITNKLPDVNMLMQHSDNIVLGTDSLASNDQLSILEEIKTLQNNFKEPDLAILLKWATSNGAKALQMDEKLGSFEKGKQPGRAFNRRKFRKSKQAYLIEVSINNLSQIAKSLLFLTSTHFWYRPFENLH